MGNTVNQLQPLRPEPFRDAVLAEPSGHVLQLQMFKSRQWNGKGADSLAQPVVRHSDYRVVAHSRTSFQPVIDLVGIQILAAADDHILLSSNNANIPRFIHDAQITAVKPSVIIQGTVRNLLIL